MSWLPVKQAPTWEDRLKIFKSGSYTVNQAPIWQTGSYMADEAADAGRHETTGPCGVAPTKLRSDIRTGYFFVWVS